MLEFVVHRGESIAASGQRRGRGVSRVGVRAIAGVRALAGVVAVASGVAVAGGVAGCGGSEQNAGEPHARFPVSIASSFPAEQRLAQRTSFMVRVKNVGSRAIPDVAVTVLNPRYGSAAQAFGTLIPANAGGQPILATRSRPVWIVDQEPGPCRYSCHLRGPGGAATAYSDTWALGRLAPGRTAVFRWQLTAVQAGAYRVEYEVAAGLNGYAKAVLAGGAAARGHVDVHISSAPPAVTVHGDGRVTQRA